MERSIFTEIPDVSNKFALLGGKFCPKYLATLVNNAKLIPNRINSFEFDGHQYIPFYKNGEFGILVYNEDDHKAPSLEVKEYSQKFALSDFKSFVDSMPGDIFEGFDLPVDVANQYVQERGWDIKKRPIIKARFYVNSLVKDGFVNKCQIYSVSDGFTDMFHMTDEKFAESIQSRGLEIGPRNVYGYGVYSCYNPTNCFNYQNYKRNLLVVTLCANGVSRKGKSEEAPACKVDMMYTRDDDSIFRLYSNGCCLPFAYFYWQQEEDNDED